MKLILHGHHNRLISLLPSIEKRISQIKEQKPQSEHSTRLRLIRKLTEEEIGRLPEVVRKAAVALGKAHAKHCKKDAEWRKKDTEWRKAALRKADAECVSANAALSKTLSDNTLLESWHKSVCVFDCTWNGKTIL